jgi:hypothetical protein
MSQSKPEPKIDQPTLVACMGDATDGMKQLTEDVTTLADVFRQHDIGRANYLLAQLAQNLQALIVLVQELRGPVTNAGSAVHLPSDQEAEKLVAMLETLVSAQSTQDWLTVADVLEYDMEPELRAWLERFESIRQACAA